MQQILRNRKRNRHCDVKSKVKFLLTGGENQFTVLILRGSSEISLHEAGRLLFQGKTRSSKHPALFTATQQLLE